MSNVREGRRLANEAQKMTMDMRDGVVTGTTSDQGVQGGAKAAQFPRMFNASDRMDDEIRIRQQLMDKDGMTPFGQVYYDDKIGRWMQKKEAAVEEANYDSWFNKNFNKNNLADRQFAQKINPRFYSEREQLMIARAEEALNLKLIQLRGPQSKEDLYKLYLIETGRVVLPPDWDRLGADPSGGKGLSTNDSKKQMRSNFKKGLVRVPKYNTQDKRSLNAYQNSYNRAWGNMASAQNTFRMTKGNNDPNGLFSKAPDAFTSQFGAYQFREE